MQNEMKYLKEKAIDIRWDIIDMSHRAEGRPVHVGPALSSVEIITALYNKILRIDPENPDWPARDRFIISKGHACPVTYAALAERGYFSKEELLTVRGFNSRLQGHPDMNKTPGIDFTSGSLGNGLAAGVGIALGMQLRDIHAKVYVLLGDGECQEGLVWEAAMAAPRLGACNLVAIVDNNHYQSCGATDGILNMEPFADKWKSFGWKVLEMNGHNMEEVVSTLQVAKEFAGTPVCVIAHTVKGKGFSFTEHNNKWHVGSASDEEYKLAKQELEEARRALA